MTPPHRTNAPEGAKADIRTLGTLLPYLWPSGEWGLRARVVWSMIFLVAAKVANVTVPLFYKQAVDVLTAKNTSAETVLVVVPVALLVAYGVTRVLAQAFGELRDAVFAKVSQRAIRQIAQQTFKHLHTLSLRFHLDRKTGGISRAIERGSRGIEFLLGFMAFSVIPTLLEVLFVCGVLWALYDFRFALITFVTISGYIYWTFAV
ncbi:MAG: ABC transporter transmembrane domain-containing protein, partial [Alphaproteobacteria bacterium]